MVTQGPDAAFSISVRLEPEDIVHFAKWQKDLRRGRVIPALFGLIFFLGLAVMIIVSLAAEFVLGLICGIAVVGSLVVLTRASNATARRSSAKRAEFASGTLTVDRVGVRCESVYGTTSYRWNAFTDVVDTGDHLFLLTICPDCAVIVPKRDFQSRGAAGALADFAEARIRAGRGALEASDPSITS